MTTLTDAFARLSTSQSALKISIITTRVMLETGVNLKAVRPDQDHDQATVAKVLAVIEDMGVAV
jgi:hypothetical protein